MENECHIIVDECLENTVAPVVKLSASTCTNFGTVEMHYKCHRFLGGRRLLGMLFDSQPHNKHVKFRQGHTLDNLLSTWSRSAEIGMLQCPVHHI